MCPRIQNQQILIERREEKKIHQLISRYTLHTLHTSHFTLPIFPSHYRVIPFHRRSVEEEEGDIPPPQKKLIIKFIFVPFFL